LLSAFGVMSTASRYPDRIALLAKLRRYDFEFRASQIISGLIFAAL
jgi:hypothetical protein